MWTIINPVCFSKNETQMITISKCKMPLPYGKCKCFQSGTCSVRSRTDALIRLLCFLNVSANRELDKEWRVAGRLQQRKARDVPADKLPVILRSTSQFMMDASVYVMSYNNFCAPERTLMSLGSQEKIGLQMNSEHSGFLLQCLFLGDKQNTGKRDACSFFHSFSSGFQENTTCLVEFPDNSHLRGQSLHTMLLL